MTDRTDTTELLAQALAEGWDKSGIGYGGGKFTVEPINDEPARSDTTAWHPYGWIRFYDHETEPWPTFPVVVYFIERSEDGCDWPMERNKSLLSFWLGWDAIPECLR